MLVTIFIISMNWITFAAQLISNPLVVAVISAVSTLAGREFIVHYKKPKLNISFQRFDEGSIYVHERTVQPKNQESNKSDTGSVTKTKHLELNVENNGKTVANHCEAKVQVWKDEQRQPVEPLLLRWGRRPRIEYDRTEIGPISINVNDEEPLRFLQLNYAESKSGEIKEVGELTLEGFRRFIFEPNEVYNIKVTVFSENAREPTTKVVHIKWDGSTTDLREALLDGDE